MAASQPPTSTAEQIIYSFKGGKDGAQPTANVIATNGMLYGTTSAGGSGCSGGCGTVFSASASGSEHVLYRFRGGADGAYPQAGLIVVKGKLYGTTIGTDVTSDYGTVFSVDPSSGKERVVYAFKGGADGANPNGNVIAVNGTLYGTTVNGGTSTCTHSGFAGCGTLFEMSTSGAESVVYSFKGGKNGAHPEAGLVDISGTLYGTTSYGGAGKCTGGIASGCGTIFGATPSGTASVLYSFKGGKDGAKPNASLIVANGRLYSTTFDGGGAGCDGAGCGTVFSTSASGGASVVYRFKTGANGANPIAGLTAMNGAFFGTAANGAIAGCYGGCGSAFETSASGKTVVLHEFAGGTDGGTPIGGLFAMNGILYGTTYDGGGSGCGGAGCGTIFEVTP